MFCSSLFLFCQCDLIPTVTVSTDKIELDYQEQTVTVTSKPAIDYILVYSTNLSRSWGKDHGHGHGPIIVDGFFSVSLDVEHANVIVTVKENQTDSIRCFHIIGKSGKGTAPEIEVIQHSKQ